jgi:hypothetical protein
MHNEASRATLEHEFGTSNDREVISHILEKGVLQEGTVRNNLSLPLLSSPSLFRNPVRSFIVPYYTGSQHKAIFFKTSSNHPITRRPLNDKQLGTNHKDHETFIRVQVKTDR